MNEKELKDKLNGLRAEINGRRKEISQILSEVRAHQKEINSLRQLRDEGNEKCKTLSKEARQLREKRDALNRRIGELKEERRKISDKIKSLSSDIKDSKVKRDELNRSARGTDESLSSRYQRDIDALLNKDIPLDKEVKLFDGIFTLMQRLEAAKEATEFHKKVISTYEGIKGLDDAADGISNEIRSFADESEKYHLQAVEIYGRVDELRKEADEHHRSLLEKYELVNPLRDRITALRGEIEKVQEEMAPYAEEMDKIRAKREEEKKAKLAVEAKEKLKTSKRITFEDFRAIIEGEEINGPAESSA